MTERNATNRFSKIYARLLRLYPRSFRDRHSESMLQTFNDLLRERSTQHTGLTGYALWMILDTLTGIVTMNLQVMLAQHKRIIRIVVVVALLLMIPLLTRMDWSLGDFVAAGILLLGSGLTYEFVSRRSTDSKYRWAVGIAVAAGLLLTWINLAVGLIGSENNPANQLYGAVILIGMIGAILARFRAPGMARALYVTATAQFLVPIIALIIWNPQFSAGEGPGVIGIFILNGFFAALFLASGVLFKESSRTPIAGA